MDGKNTKSNTCKSKCLDDENMKFIFCPGRDFKFGSCCHVWFDRNRCPVGKTTYDPRYAMNRNWCSNHNDARGAPLVTKYLVCPNEVPCGDNGNKFITPELEGTLYTRMMETREEHRFVKPDVCSFVIKNPPGMGWKDWMWLQIDKIENADVHVWRGYDYYWDRRSQLERVASSMKFGMLKGKDFYVVGEATSVFPGNYRIRTWIYQHVKPIPPPVPIVKPATKVVKPKNTEVVDTNTVV